MSSRAALEQLLTLCGVEEPPGSKVTIRGEDPVVPSPYRLGEAAAAALGAQGAAIAELWAQRSGHAQQVTVDVAEAALSLKSVNYLLQRGYPVPFPDPAYPTIGFYPTLDNRRIMLHGGYPGLRDKLLELLGCANTAKAIGAAVAQRDAQELEDTIAKAGACGTIARTAKEWSEHPQGIALAKTPLIDITPLGGPSPAEPPGPGARPLSGLRVLDLTHVLAGPTASRVLAEQGADVLRISAPGRPVIQGFIMDTGHGKLSTLLKLMPDVNTDESPSGRARAARDMALVEEDRKRFRDLLSEADVLLYSYRPGGLERMGFSDAELARIRPGLIYASVSCYGEVGDWHERPGWEQLAQTCTGMALTQGEALGKTEPELSVVFPNDYVTGYLTAYGILAAVLKRGRRGGGYRVRTSLCRTAMWLQTFQPVPKTPLPSDDALDRIARRLIQKGQTAWGPLSYMGPVTRFSATSARWERPTTPLAHDPVLWPAGPRFSDHSPETADEAALYAREITQM